MLHGENFGGGHQGHLPAIFNDDGGGLESHDGFSAAHIAFEQAVHRNRPFEVGGNFREDAFLRIGGLEREDALEGFTDARLANAKGDAGLAFSLLTAQRKAQLVEKKTPRR